MLIKLMCDKMCDIIQLLRIKLHLPHQFPTKSEDRKGTNLLLVLVTW